MSFPVEEYESFDELDISVFCADAIMLETDVMAYLFEQRRLIGHEGNSGK
jgi:hypothetical protein